MEIVWRHILGMQCRHDPMLMCEKCRWEFEVIGELELELEQLQPARVYPTTYFGNDEQPHSPVTNIALQEQRDRHTKRSML